MSQVRLFSAHRDDHQYHPYLSIMVSVLGMVQRAPMDVEDKIVEMRLKKI